jgi:ECF sigma factor
MGEDLSQDISGLLQAWGRGQVEARDELQPLVYRELRRRAAAYLRRERVGHTGSHGKTALIFWSGGGNDATRSSWTEREPTRWPNGPAGG